MAFFVQHGTGKGDKIERLVAQPTVVGVIFGAAYESPEGLRDCAQAVGKLGAVTLLDSQSYLYSVSGASSAKLESHDLCLATRAEPGMDPADIESQVGAVVRLNQDLGILGPILGATVVQQAFDGESANLAMQYARASLRQGQKAGRDVVPSVVVEESALTNWEAIERWLDRISAPDVGVSAVYVCVVRPGSYIRTWPIDRLANLMRVSYRLRQNNIGVYVGYADLDGLAVLAAGATSIASGWHQTLRQLNLDKWVTKRSGGNPPIPRVTSAALLTPIELIGEADAILRLSEAAVVFPDATLRAILGSAAPAIGGPIAASSTSGVKWGSPEAPLQHLTVLSQLAVHVDSAGEVPLRIDRFEQMVERARNLRSSLVAKGAVLAPAYDTRLRALADACKRFREKEKLPTRRTPPTP